MKILMGSCIHWSLMRRDFAKLFFVCSGRTLDVLNVAGDEIGKTAT